MKINLSLLNRFLIGVVLLSVLTISSTYFLIRQIKVKDRLTRTISDDFQPSISYLAELTDKYKESKNLIIYWGNADRSSDLAFRDNLEQLFLTDINPLLENLTILSVKWNPEDIGLFKSANILIRDSLFYSYINLISDYRDSQGSESINAGIGDFIDQNDILFLLSEVDQNLSFLLDKRKTGMNENFQLIEKSALKIRKTLIGFTILIIAIVILFSLWTYGFIKQTTRELNKNLKLLAQGIIPSPIETIRKDETGTVFELMNKLFAYLKNLTIVSQKINEKEFTNIFQPLSEKDELGIALLNLQKNLKTASDEEERRKKEDNERSWTSEGIAKINDILRLSSDRLEELTYNLIREIAAFTSSQVGVLYIINDNSEAESYIEIIAAFAYDRQKYLNKKIDIGEGLVGRCVQENETIYLTDVPANYLNVKSGLGESKPVCILIVPLHLNNKVYGVIELASFSLLDPYKIRFVETIGENIATSLSKVKINLRTAGLLEQTSQQTREMAAQEEASRLRIEQLQTALELSTAREENLRNEIELLRKVKSE